MTRRIPVLVICLVTLGSRGTPTVVADDEQPVIEIRAKEGRVIKIVFTADELKKADAVDLVKKRLANQGGKSADCPDPRQKLGDGVWLCGDGTIIKTPYKALQEFLTTILDKADE